MKSDKMAKLRSHLEGAIACLDEMGDMENGTAPEFPSEEKGESDDMGSKSLKMRLLKYKD